MATAQRLSNQRGLTVMADPRAYLPVPVTVSGRGKSRVTKNAYVSPEDHALVSGHTWSLHKTSGYAYRKMTAEEHRAVGSPQIKTKRKLKSGAHAMGYKPTMVFMHVQIHNAAYVGQGNILPPGTSNPLMPHLMRGGGGGRLRKGNKGKQYVVDHINAWHPLGIETLRHHHDARLNNTRSNLRILTWQENAMNRIQDGKNSTGYRGVRSVIRKGQIVGYKAAIKVGRKTHSTPTFKIDTTRHGTYEAAKDHALHSAALGFGVLAKSIGRAAKYATPNVIHKNHTTPERTAAIHKEVSYMMSPAGRKSASAKKKRAEVKKAKEKVGARSRQRTKLAGRKKVGGITGGFSLHESGRRDLRRRGLSKHPVHGWVKSEIAKRESARAAEHGGKKRRAPAKQKGPSKVGQFVTRKGGLVHGPNGKVFQRHSHRARVGARGHGTAPKPGHAGSRRQHAHGAGHHLMHH